MEARTTSRGRVTVLRREATLTRRVCSLLTPHLLLTRHQASQCWSDSRRSLPRASQLHTRADCRHCPLAPPLPGPHSRCAVDKYTTNCRCDLNPRPTILMRAHRGVRAQAQIATTSRYRNRYVLLRLDPVKGETFDVPRGPVVDRC